LLSFVNQVLKYIIKQEKRFVVKILSKKEIIDCAYSYTSHANRELISASLVRSDSVDLFVPDQGVIPDKSFLVLLLEVESALVVLSVSVLAAKHILTLTREP